MKKSRFFRIFAVLAVFFAAFVSQAFAGEFRVMPIKLELDSTDKIGTITVSNDGKDKLDLQIKLMEWTQDELGKDVYTPSTDMVYFPKLTTIAPGEDQVIRIGLKKNDFSKEQTYRLYIEEIPNSSKVTRTSVGLLIAMRFAAPIFVKPVKIEEKGEIGGVDLVKGNLNVTMVNTGNVHYSVNVITVKGKDSSGKEVLSKEIKGWYVLSGSKKVFTVPLDNDCAKATELDVEISTSDFIMGRDFKVDPSMCR